MPGVYRLHEAVSGLARTAEFYQAPCALPDTIDGRFDLLGLLVGTLCLRLSQLPDGQPASQAVFDVTFRHLERNMREAGIGDLSVPKHMRRMIKAFYLRNSKYAEILLQAGGVPGDGQPVDALAAVLAGNLYGKESAASSPGGAAMLAQWLLAVWWPLLLDWPGANTGTTAEPAAGTASLSQLADMIDALAQNLSFPASSADLSRPTPSMNHDQNTV